MRRIKLLLIIVFSCIYIGCSDDLDPSICNDAYDVPEYRRCYKDDGDDKTYKYYECVYGDYNGTVDCRDRCRDSGYRYGECDYDDRWVAYCKCYN